MWAATIASAVADLQTLWDRKQRTPMGAGITRAQNGDRLLIMN
jgi:hypothetical protein